MILGWEMAAGVHDGSCFAPVSRRQSIRMVLAGSGGGEHIELMQYDSPAAAHNSPVDEIAFVKGVPKCRRLSGCVVEFRFLVCFVFFGHTRSADARGALA